MKARPFNTYDHVYDTLVQYATYLGIPFRYDGVCGEPLWDGKTLALNILNRSADDLAHEIAHWVLEADFRDQVNYGWGSDYQTEGVVGDRFVNIDDEMLASMLGFTYLVHLGFKNLPGIYSMYAFTGYDGKLGLLAGRTAGSIRREIEHEANFYLVWLKAFEADPT